MGVGVKHSLPQGEEEKPSPLLSWCLPVGKFIKEASPHYMYLPWLYYIVKIRVPKVARVALDVSQEAMMLLFSTTFNSNEKN